MGKEKVIQYNNNANRGVGNNDWVGLRQIRRMQAWAGGGMHWPTFSFFYTYNRSGRSGFC
jgi:hypothetical protein